MGYACPVCDVPQRDAEHLANHLAFTAMLHGDDHESWLDDHVPEWSARGPTELAESVGELAEEAEYDEVFEDTVDRHAHEPPVAGTGFDADAADPATRDVLEEARELTHRMLEDEDEKA